MSGNFEMYADTITRWGYIVATVIVFAGLFTASAVVIYKYCRETRKKGA